MAQPMCLVTASIDALHELGVTSLLSGTPYLVNHTAEAEFLVERASKC
jgi:hypothetical protein